METPIYQKLVIDESSEFFTGVFAVGIVENPAIEVEWVAMNKEFEKLEFSVNSEKKIVTGPFMIPYKFIPRENGTKIVFADEATIEKASELFFKHSFHSRTTHEHLMPLDGNTVVESWIIHDSENDKAKSLGFDLPKGTWMLSVKITSDDYWQNYVKTGKVKGFSIEGFFAHETVGPPLELEKHSKKNMKNKYFRNKKKSNKTKFKMSLKSLLKRMIDSVKFSEESIEEMAGQNFVLEFLTESGAYLEITPEFVAVNEEGNIYEAGEYTVTDISGTARFVLEIAEEGKLLVIKTPHALISEEENLESSSETDSPSGTETLIEEMSKLKNELEYLKKMRKQGVKFSKPVDKNFKEKTDSVDLLSALQNVKKSKQK